MKASIAKPLCGARCETALFALNAKIHRNFTLPDVTKVRIELLPKNAVRPLVQLITVNALCHFLETTRSAGGGGM
jgi:hypothetical protein